MFVRFVVGADSEHHQGLTGIFTEARILGEEGELTDEEAARLEGLYDWFNDNLPVPPFETANWPRFAVAWFKDDASDSIARIWDLVALLREHNVPVRMLKSKQPGRVLYEDDFQVVVDEWGRL